MGKGQLYEISFFIYLVYVLLNKFVALPILSKFCLGLCAVALIYEILFLVFFRREDYVSFGRAFSMGLVYVSLIGIILIAIYVGYSFINGARSVANLMSIESLNIFFKLPDVIVFPYANLVFAIAFVVYIIAYTLITRKLDNRINF